MRNWTKDHYLGSLADGRRDHLTLFSNYPTTVTSYSPTKSPARDAGEFSPLLSTIATPKESDIKVVA